MLTLLVGLALAQPPQPVSPKAQQAYARLAPAYTSFVGRKLTGTSAATFQTAVRESELLVEAMTGDFQAVIALGDPTTTVAATVRTGQLYWHLAEMLATAEVPLSVQKRGQKAEATWKRSNGSRVVVYRDKARQLWKQAHDLALKSNVKPPELSEVAALIDVSP